MRWGRPICAPPRLRCAVLHVMPGDMIFAPLIPSNVPRRYEHAMLGLSDQTALELFVQMQSKLYVGCLLGGVCVPCIYRIVDGSGLCCCIERDTIPGPLFRLSLSVVLLFFN